MSLTRPNDTLTFWNRRLIFVGVVAAALLWSTVATAQAEVASAEARTAQYVFVIDDSGSMSRRVGGKPAADPNRLAVFAVRSTLSMLDDADEATVVRLNGPDEGQTPPRIAPLSENRTALEGMLSLDGPIAAYDGERTPCKTALESVTEVLNDAYRPNVAQVVMFLTDGECTGGTPNPSAIMGGLDSAEDELFKFFLLRFQGRDYTETLETLAKESGGMAISASADDPTAILEPFASALSRSQGYEAYLLRPGDNRLGAHRGARRVRLLAVAPDKGTPLSFEISPARKGEDPERIGAPQKGVHQWQSGPRYRYAALDYKPGTVPVSISVDGAGRDWRVVAVPEYRIFVEMNVRQGLCDEDGEPTQYVEVGSNVCVDVKLINERGETLTSDVASRGTDAALRYTPPGADEPRELPANRVGDQARFVIERANLERGDHVFRPLVHMAVPGEQTARVTLRGAANSLQVSSVNVSSQPSRLELGKMVPGGEEFQELEIRGNFPSTRARLVVENRDEVPECVNFAFNGEEEGEAQTITPDQSYTLEVGIAPYCGPNSFTRDIQTAVRLEFDKSSGLVSVPTLVVPVSLSLVNEIRVPEKVSASIEAGDAEEIALDVRGNFTRESTFDVIVPPIDERRSWPGDDLDLVFLDEDGDIIERAGEDEPARAREVTFSPSKDDDTLRMKLVSDACCGGGSYQTELAMVSKGGSKEPIRVPIQVEVEEAGVWLCWGPAILWVLAALLLILLIAYIVNMIRSSHFLDRDRLADKLVPLKWDMYGTAQEDKRAAGRVHQVVKRNLKLQDRALAWLKSNPLKIGLPGYEYHETVYLTLTPRSVQHLALGVVEMRDKYAEVQEAPEMAVGQIFATARHGGVEFFGVPDDEGRFGAVKLQDGYHGGGYGADEGPECQRIRREQLIDNSGEKREGDPAGWRVG
ncbi:MAG: VWA domain-containing protein [Myxococcota bacterium]